MGGRLVSQETVAQVNVREIAYLFEGMVEVFCVLYRKFHSFSDKGGLKISG